MVCRYMVVPETWQRLMQWRSVYVYSYHAWIYHHDSRSGLAVLYPPARWAYPARIVLLAHHSLFQDTGEKVRICREGRKPICHSNPELIYERPYVRLRNGVAVIARFDPASWQLWPQGKRYHAFTLLDPTRGIRRVPEEWLIFVGPIELQLHFNRERWQHIEYSHEALKRLVVEERNISVAGTYQRAYIVFLLREGEYVEFRVVRPDRDVAEVYTITAPPQLELQPREERLS